MPYLFPPSCSYHHAGYPIHGLWRGEDLRQCLQLDDIRTYCRIVTALKLTIGIQGEIDVLYPEIEKETVPLPQSIPWA
jgi:hypothetical protein